MLSNYLCHVLNSLLSPRKAFLLPTTSVVPALCIRCTSTSACPPRSSIEVSHPLCYSQLPRHTLPSLYPSPSVPILMDAMTRTHFRTSLLHSPFKHLFFQFLSFLWCHLSGPCPPTLDNSALLPSVSSLQEPINCHMRAVQSMIQTTKPY